MYKNNKIVKGKKIMYKGYTIQEVLWTYKDTGSVFDITYSLYDSVGKFLTNYMESNLEIVKQDIDKFWNI